MPASLAPWGPGSRKHQPVLKGWQTHRPCAVTGHVRAQAVSLRNFCQASGYTVPMAWATPPHSAFDKSPTRLQIRQYQTTASRTSGACAPLGLHSRLMATMRPLVWPSTSTEMLGLHCKKTTQGCSCHSTTKCATHNRLSQVEPGSVAAERARTRESPVHLEQYPPRLGSAGLHPCMRCGGIPSQAAASMVPRRQPELFCAREAAC